MEDDKVVEWYILVIKRELSLAKEGKLTGNIEFKFNFKDGGIANVNCGLGRSFKMPVSN